MNEKKLLVGFLVKTLNMTEEQITSLLYKDEGDELKEGALEAVLSKDADRIKALSSDDDVKDKIDNAYARGRKETAKEFEKGLKDKFDIDSDLKGNELIDFVKAESDKKVKSDLDEDKIKTSKTYQDAIALERKAKDDAVAAVQKEYDDYKSDVSNRESQSRVMDKAGAIFDSLNPVLSQNPEVAANQRKTFLEQVASGKFNVEGDKIIPLDSEGKVLTNDHGHDIHFEDLVKTKTKSYFDLSNTPRKNATPDKDKEDETIDRTGWNWTGSEITSHDEFMKLSDKAQTKEERGALLKAYDEFKASEED